MGDDNSQRSLSERLRGKLDSQGYSFHQSVLKRTEQLFQQGRSNWIFVASEFPVEVKGVSTRIDFILRLKNTQIFLIAECKRVNPAYSDWCFVRLPYVGRRSEATSVLAESVSVLEHNRVMAGYKRFRHSQNVFHLGLEVKSSEKGDSGGSGRGAIEEAAGQVCRGLNGFAESLARHTYLIGAGQTALLVPVVFTTGGVSVSDVNLSEADLRSGKLDPATVSVRPASWLWYRYHLSPGLKHSLPIFSAPSDVSEMLDVEYARTIAIVDAEGIGDFLASEWWD